MGASGNDLFAMQRAFNMRRRVHVYAGSIFQPRSSSKQKNFQPMIMLRHDKPSLFFLSYRVSRKSKDSESRSSRQLLYAPTRVVISCRSIII